MTISGVPAVTPGTPSFQSPNFEEAHADFVVRRCRCEWAGRLERVEGGEGEANRCGGCHLLRCALVERWTREWMGFLTRAKPHVSRIIFVLVVIAVCFLVLFVFVFACVCVCVCGLWLVVVSVACGCVRGSGCACACCGWLVVAVVVFVVVGFVLVVVIVVVLGASPHASLAASTET